MEKEFVPYEIAVELKQIGFDEPCFFAFDNCSTPMRCSDLRTNQQQFNGVNYNSSSYTSQPTYSQAFRFFREKYDITQTVARDGSLAKEGPWAYTIVSDYIFFNDGYLSYEEAESACLKKLIEIVKNK